jgi:maltose alpha-D-glucosyltransferase/alpha-amylase
VFLALTREDPEPIRRALDELPKLPVAAQWANFIKNHDELTLDKLTDAEREEVFARFAPDPDMRSFGRGIRRRVPTMLEGDQVRMRLLYSLLLSLPGTPVLLYGEEIGLGDDQSVPDRAAVRIAMQWKPGPGAGFTTGEPRVPLVVDGPFGADQVNVAGQRRDPESLLNWTERAIRTRKELPELGWGECRVLATDADAVLAHRCDWRGRGVLVLHNLTPAPLRVTVDADDLGGDRNDADLEEILSDADYEPVRPGAPIELGGYGWRWLRVPR